MLLLNAMSEDNRTVTEDWLTEKPEVKDASTFHYHLMLKVLFPLIVIIACISSLVIYKDS